MLHLSHLSSQNLHFIKGMYLLKTSEEFLTLLCTSLLILEMPFTISLLMSIFLIPILSEAFSDTTTLIFSGFFFFFGLYFCKSNFYIWHLYTSYVFTNLWGSYISEVTVFLVSNLHIEFLFHSASYLTSIIFVLIVNKVKE